MLLYLLAILVGIIVLARAADVFVLGAADLSLRLGLSAVVVGAVVIGFGTSAPELLVSGIAAAEGSADVGVGNLLGSNLFNSLAVGGVVALLAPGPLGESNLTTAGVLAMVATSVVAMVVISTGRSVSRFEAVLLLVFYAALLPFLG